MTDATRGAVHLMGERLRRAGGGIRWYMTNLMGDRAYAAYLEHHAAHHAGEAPLSERAFWRERMDAQDANPGARCC